MSDEKFSPESPADPHRDAFDPVATTEDPVVLDEVIVDESAPAEAAQVDERSEASTQHTAAQEVTDAPPHYGVGPFSLREVALLGVWLVAFIVSFFSVWVEMPISAAIFAFGSVWNSGIDWILTIGVPTVAVFLIVLRRFSPDGIRRVGSLAVDQFASVAFSVSAVVWLGMLWTNISRAAQTGLWLSSWVVWVEFFLMLAGVVLTVLAPFIAPFDADFRHRPEVAAHRNARPARPVTARPAIVSSFAPAVGGDTAQPAGAQSVHASGESAESESPFASLHADDAAATPVADEYAVADSSAAHSPHQAFWALAPVPRDVVDQDGTALFTVGPTAWALVIEDRGDSFVVRHEDGRVGYLHDVSGVTRG